jgi:hypothetical protein
VKVFTEVRETITTLGILWANFARVLKARFHHLILLFLVGWVGYYLTVILAGTIAVGWSWAVIPFMGAGCLIQLTVTLAAYQMVIRESEKTMDATRFPSLLLLALITSLLVPFSAAYSSFGYFGQYGHDALIAASSMSGSLSDLKFLADLNPVASPITTVISVGVFLALWIGIRVIKHLTANKKTFLWSIVCAFLSACMTFLVLFSLFHVFARINFWWRTRQFMAWKDQGLEWLGNLIPLTVPPGLVAAWDWIMHNVWSIFWNTLSQPIVWLTIVAVVGGMQFMKLDTVWNTLRTRLGMEETSETASLVFNNAPGFLFGPLPGLLRLLHMFTVVLRTGVPFLAALVLSHGLLTLAGRWLTYLVSVAMGPLPHQYVMLVQPLLSVINMVVIAMCQAVILAVAYVRMRQLKVDMHPEALLERIGVATGQASTANHETATSTKVSATTRTWSRRLGGLLTAILAIALAAGLNSVRPGSTDPVVPIELGATVTLLNESVTVADLRIGSSLQGTIIGSYGEEPVNSLGVFVAVSISVSGHSTGAVQVRCIAGGVDYPAWHGYASLSHGAGFTTTADVVFEVPRETLNDLKIIVLPVQIDFTSQPRAVFTVPTGRAVDRVIWVDESRFEEVSR